MPPERIMHCIALVLPLVLTACSNSGGSSPPVLLGDSIGAWTASQAPEVFRGEALYQHIDGAAELYDEYGFEQVSVNDYRKGSSLVTVEHYTMLDSDAAFGIFSLLRPSGGEPVELGSAASLSDLQLLCYSGRDLLVLTAQDLETGREALLEIATTLATQLPATNAEAGRPALLGVLPKERRIAGSEGFLRGPIALRNLAPRLAPLFPSFTEAVSARYQDGEVLTVVLLLHEEAAARAVMTEASEQAASIPGAEIMHRGDDRLCLDFAGGEALDARRDGRLVWLSLANQPWQLSGVAAERPGVVLEE